MSHLKQWALWCAGKGYRVFPLRAGEKRPAIKAFPVAATTDATAIEQWWSENENYNVGICTTNFVVVDLDTAKHTDALDSFTLLGGDPYKTFTVRTPSGGLHCYYDAGDYSNSASDIAAGVDVRSHHGYVVGPGSVTPKGTYEILIDLPRAIVPQPIRTLLKPPPALRTRDDLGERDAPISVQQAIDYLRTAPPAIEGQGGDSQTFKVAAKITRDFALSIDTAYNLMLDHYNPRCSPPWAWEELYAKVEHAEAYGQNDVGSQSAATQFAGINPIPTPPPAEAPAAPPVTGVYLDNLPEPTELKPRPWLAQNLLMRGQVTMLAGMGAAGKSILELTVAAHLSLGIDFGPFPLREKRQHRIMMYNSEDELDEQARRLWAVCDVYKLPYRDVKRNIIGMDASQDDLLLARPNPDRTVQMVEGNMRFVEETALANKIDVMMFDPLLNIHALSEDDNPSMRFFLTQMRNLATRANASLLIAHHTRKGMSKDTDDPGNFRGASAITDTPRIAIMLSSSEGPDAVKQKEMNGGKVLPKKYIRLDNAKANYTPRTGEALMWMEWHTSKNFHGDIIGVPKAFDAVTREKEEFNNYEHTVRHAVYDLFIDAGVGSMRLGEVMAGLRAKGLIDTNAPDTSTTRRPVERALSNKIFNGLTFNVVRESNTVLITMK